MKKRSEATQTLRAGCSKAVPTNKQTHKQTGTITITPTLRSLARSVKRLATANRSRVSVRVTKIWRGLYRGVIDPVKLWLSTSLITIENIVALCHTVWAFVGGPKNLRGAEDSLPWYKGIAKPLKHSSPSDVLPCRIWYLYLYVYDDGLVKGCSL